jgi:proline iminopeptidase
VLEEFGERLLAPMADGDRARVGEIEAKENAGTATPEESKECLSLFWPSYFADPSTAPPMPEIDVSPTVYPATMASIRAHGDAQTLDLGLPQVPAEIPVLFLHGAESPMPMRASTDTAKLIPHADVEVVEGAGHFIWHERPAEVRDAVRAFAGRFVAQFIAPVRSSSTREDRSP